MLVNPWVKGAARGHAPIASLLSLSLLGCASSYQPANSPRIAAKLDGGVVLVRDGYEYPVGMFGSGAMDAVRGNPVAEEHARALQNNSIVGWSLYGVGLGATVAGLGMANDAEPQENREATGAALGLAGVGAVIAGALFLVHGNTHLWDAVNAYNDGVDARLRRQWYPPPPHPSARPPDF
jgi:hypothetical protein